MRPLGEGQTDTGGLAHEPIRLHGAQFRVSEEQNIHPRLGAFCVQFLHKATGITTFLVLVKTTTRARNTTICVATLGVVTMPKAGLVSVLPACVVL